MKFLVRIYRDTTCDICEEFERYKEAEEFAKKYERYAIFELLLEHDSYLKEES